MNHHPTGREYDHYTHHGWAVNVKDYGTYDPSLDPDELVSDDEKNAIYGECQDGFWRDAEHIAQERGFRDIYSEGRMGGWAVPSPQPADETAFECGAAEARLRALDREFRESIAYWVEEYRTQVRESARLAAAEPAEAAYWAARDVVTV